LIQAFLCSFFMKKLPIIALFILSFSFTSCIELVEEIRVLPDLSGDYHLYLKHNGLGLLLNFLPEKLQTGELEKQIQELEKQKGISQFSYALNPRMGKFSVSFHFSNARNLTRAFYNSFGAPHYFFSKPFLRVTENNIVRPNMSAYLIRFLEESNLKSQIPSEKLLDYVSYRYRVVCHKEIETAYPLPTRLGSDLREYNLVIPLKEIVLNNRSTASRIVLKH